MLLSIFDGSGFFIFFVIYSRFVFKLHYEIFASKACDPTRQLPKNYFVATE